MTNLLSSDTGTTKVYVHSGITGTITSSFNAPSLPLGLAMDGSGNLLISATDNDIYVMAGVSGTIASSFGVPGDITDITLDGSGNLLCADWLADLWRGFVGVMGTPSSRFF